MLRLSLLIAVTVVLGAASSPARAVSFGADLDSGIPPASSTTETCDAQAHKCTFLLIEAFNNPEAERAPRDGKIGKIRLMACGAGKLRIVIARFNPNNERAEVARFGPQINYRGDPNDCAGATFRIETFNLEKGLRVDRGDYLAIEAGSLHTIRCASRPTATLRFLPPLKAGANSRKPSSESNCHLLIEAVYK